VSVNLVNFRSQKVVELIPTDGHSLEAARMAGYRIDYRGRHVLLNSNVCQWRTQKLVFDVQQHNQSNKQTSHKKHHIKILNCMKKGKYITGNRRYKLA